MSFVLQTASHVFLELSLFRNARPDTNLILSGMSVSYRFVSFIRKMTVWNIKRSSSPYSRSQYVERIASQFELMGMKTHEETKVLDGGNQLITHLLHEYSNNILHPALLILLKNSE